MHWSGFDHPEASSKRPRAAALIDVIATELPSALRGADLVYIAMPIGATIEALPAIAAAAEPDALVTDACSTKTVLCKAAAEHFRNGARFLGGHPMAGKNIPASNTPTRNYFAARPTP